MCSSPVPACTPRCPGRARRRWWGRRWPRWRSWPCRWTTPPCPWPPARWASVDWLAWTTWFEEKEHKRWRRRNRKIFSLPLPQPNRWEIIWEVFTSVANFQPLQLPEASASRSCLAPEKWTIVNWDCCSVLVRKRWIINSQSLEF